MKLEILQRNKFIIRTTMIYNPLLRKFFKNHL